MEILLMTAKHEKRAARSRNGEAVLTNGNFVNNLRMMPECPRKKFA